MLIGQSKLDGSGVFRRACLVGLTLGSLALAGCGKSMSGKYEVTGEAAGSASVEFKSSSKAYLSIMGTTFDTDYTLDGDKVTFHNVQGSNLVMTIESDGSLTGPMGMKLKKKG